MLCLWCHILTTWKTPGNFASYTKFCGTMGQSSLKPKNWDCPGKTMTNGIPSGSPRCWRVIFWVYTPVSSVMVNSMHRTMNALIQKVYCSDTVMLVMVTEMHKHLYAQWKYFYIFYWNWANFIKFSDTKFNENLFGSSQLVICIWKQREGNFNRYSAGTWHHLKDGTSCH